LADRDKALSALGGLWILLVGLYMVWGLFTDGGLYGWLMRLQDNWLGGHSRSATLAIPWIVLAAPAVRYLRSVSGKAEGSRSLGARRRGARQAALLSGTLGGIAALIAIGAYALAEDEKGPTGYYVAAGLAAVMAFIFITVALICLVQGPKLWVGPDA